MKLHSVHCTLEVMKLVTRQATHEVVTVVQATRNMGEYRKIPVIPYYKKLTLVLIKELEISAT